MNTSNPTDIKSIIESNKGDIAFVIGNGINRYCQHSGESGESGESWEDLLLKLWKQHSHSHSEKKMPKIPKGISFTEFYDVLELYAKNPKNTNGEKFRKEFQASIQKTIKSELEKWELSKPNKQEVLLNYIKNNLNAPILTTNFDDLMAQSLELGEEPRILKGHDKKKGFTQFYPWSSYYSNEELEHPNCGFAIWHINGMKHYHRSIKLGLSHYMKNVSHVDDLRKKNTEGVPKYNYTWLKIFFQKPLFIFGLGLEENEIFLRWLLIQRKKYFQSPIHAEKCGWYVMTPCKDKDKETVEGKKLFLESVGIKVLKVKDYDAIYKTPWS